MSLLKPVGHGAASRKYDLLTALGALALSARPGEQRLILRLMVAITARYNWATDSLAVAQTELARLWSVDERTVKRAMAEYRDRGWLRLKRQAARGRVAEYGLGIEHLLAASRPVWGSVGTDFETRLSPDVRVEATPECATIVPFPTPATECGVWPDALRMLTQDDPVTARTWLQGLREGRRANDRLHLIARGRYQATYLRTHLTGRLLAALMRVDPQISALTIEHEDA